MQKYFAITTPPFSISPNDLPMTTITDEAKALSIVSSENTEAHSSAQTTVVEQKQEDTKRADAKEEEKAINSFLNDVWNDTMDAYMIKCESENTRKAFAQQKRAAAHYAELEKCKSKKERLAYIKTMINREPNVTRMLFEWTRGVKKAIQKCPLCRHYAPQPCQQRLKGSFYIVCLSCSYILEDVVPDNK